MADGGSGSVRCDHDGGLPTVHAPEDAQLMAQLRARCITTTTRLVSRRPQTDDRTSHGTSQMMMMMMMGA